jgi:rhodanese-related sulfurtransferase
MTATALKPLPARAADLVGKVAVIVGAGRESTAAALPARAADLAGKVAVIVGAGRESTATAAALASAGVAVAVAAADESGIMRGTIARGTPPGRPTTWSPRASARGPTDR